MWCRICRQDVPVVAGPAGKVMACPRCGGRVGSASPGGRVAELEAVADGGIDLTGQQFAEVTGVTPPVDWDNWGLSQRMQAVRRMACRSTDVGQRTSWDPAHVVRVDASHGGCGRVEKSQTVVDDALAPVAEPARKMTGKRVMAWLGVGLGLASGTCGGLLAIMGFVQSRSDLWNVGLPIVVVGQFVLLLGLAFRLRLARAL